MPKRERRPLISVEITATDSGTERVDDKREDKGCGKDPLPSQKGTHTERDMHFMVKGHLSRALQCYHCNGNNTKEVSNIKLTKQTIVQHYPSSWKVIVLQYQIDSGLHRQRSQPFLVWISEKLEVDILQVLSGYELLLVFHKQDDLTTKLMVNLGILSSSFSLWSLPSSTSSTSRCIWQ